MSKIKESPLFWPAHLKGNVLYVLDETLIPAKVKYIAVKNTREAVKVIRTMKTRAFGQFLVVLNTFSVEIKNAEATGRSPLQAKLLKRIEFTAAALNASRPTFPFAEVTGIVVGWARKALAEGKDVAAVVGKNIEGYLQGIRYRRLERVQKIAALFEDGDRVLTHCNVSGELAMAAAVSKGRGKRVRFFATETRPYLQGAKLTAWELQKAGVPVTLIADNAIGVLLSGGLVSKVIIGSDRSCANGDVANKISSYQIAVVAKEFGVPLYVLTQPSAGIKRGEDIPIEVRDPREILFYEGRRVCPARVEGFYPGFDVVPHELITESIAIHAGA